MSKEILISPVESKKDYRPDIDGLRAIAILAVLFFHIDPFWLPGGFTGVDIFFVISGFLITSHIGYELTIRKDFSLKRFYLKRIKRILPALIVMILFVLFVGYYILTPYYFKALSGQALSATLSYSNIYFWLDSGYFDLDSRLKPLLHTWSLGVEEQFYLVWPILLVSIFALLKSTKGLVIVVVFMMSSSFIMNGVYAGYDEATFYLMPFRIFEFSAGAIVALLYLKNNKLVFERSAILRNVITSLALFLIIVPFIYLHSDDVFPYYNVLPTVLGTILLIYFRNTLVSKLLSTRALVLVGLLSYSLYLYHWPVIVFLEYYYAEVSLIQKLVITLVLSFLFAGISYHFIEKPFRFSQKFPVNALLILLLFISIVFSLLVKFDYVVSKKTKVVEMDIEEFLRERYFKIYPNGCSIEAPFREKACNWKADKQVLFIGNSHNLDAYNAFSAKLSLDKEINLIFSGNADACSLEISSEHKVISKNAKCPELATRLSDTELIENIGFMVVSFFKVSTWGKGYLPIVEHLKKLNPSMKVIVLGGYIGVRPQNCSELINQSGSFEICKQEEFVTYFGKNEEEWLLSQGFLNGDFDYFDRVSLLCGKSKKLENCIVRHGDEPLFYDGDHFSLNGAIFLGNKLFSAYEDRLIELGLLDGKRR